MIDRNCQIKPGLLLTDVFDPQDCAGQYIGGVGIVQSSRSCGSGDWVSADAGFNRLNRLNRATGDPAPSVADLAVGSCRPGGRTYQESGGGGELPGTGESVRPVGRCSKTVDADRAPLHIHQRDAGRAASQRLGRGPAHLPSLPKPVFFRGCEPLHGVTRHVARRATGTALTLLYGSNPGTVPASPVSRRRTATDTASGVPSRASTRPSASRLRTPARRQFHSASTSTRRCPKVWLSSPPGDGLPDGNDIGARRSCVPEAT